MQYSKLLVSTLLLAAACGDDGGTSGDPDASTNGVFDAATNTIDATPTVSDAMPDAMTAVGTCGIQFERSVPLAGEPVVFAGPDGAIYDNTVTDTNGMASSDICVDGTTITVAHTNAGVGVQQLETYSFAGVDIGVTAIFQRSVGDQDIATPSLTHTSAPAFAGAASYRTNVGCRSSMIQVATEHDNVNLQNMCLGGNGLLNILDLARDDENLEVAFDWALDLTPVANGTTAAGTLPGWKDATSVSTLITGIVGMVDFATIQLQYIRAGQIYYSSQSGLVAQQGGDFTGTNAGVPVGFADTLRAAAMVGKSIASLTALQSNSEPIAVGATAASFDFVNFLPKVEALAVSSTVPDRPSITWITTGTMGGADLLNLRLVWNDSNGQHRSLLYLPPGTGNTYQFPALPNSMAQFRPTAGAVFGTQGNFVEVDTMSYTELISGGLALQSIIYTSARNIFIPGAKIRTSALAIGG